MSTPIENAAPQTTTTIASTDTHLKQILELQGRYHVRTVLPEAQGIEGFVFAEHTLPLLRRMAQQLPQAIALSEGRVVGYCLSLPASLQGELPSLAPMFRQFERCAFRNKPLSETRFVVGGQVCVERDFRGLGLLARLYEQMRMALGPAFELCITEIATRNRVSMRAHLKMGFEVLSTYKDAGEEWAIVGWDLSGPR